MVDPLDMSSMSEAVKFIQDNLSIKNEHPPLQNFTLFPLLPAELRLKIWQLAILPRTLHLNHSSAVRTRIKLSPTVPPLLHTNHEARTEVVKHYHLSTIGPRRKMYLHPTLDTLLWIRYNGPRSFRLDSQKLLHPHTSIHVSKFAVSRKFWNRITMQIGNNELYSLIRGRGAEGWRESDGKLRYDTLVVVDDDYGYIRWSEVRGNEMKMKRVKGEVMWDFLKGRNKDMGKEELWGKWDWNGERGVWDQNGGWLGRDWREEEELAEVKFARVAFKEVK